MNNQKIFELAKGFRGRSKNCIRVARERVEKALQYAYRDRRTKKRDMRGLWIQRINAGTREHGVNYGQFMDGLVKENIDLNRKVLSELAMHEPYTFKSLVDISRISFTQAKNHGNYGQLMDGIVKENIDQNRKVLSELAMHEP